MRRGVLPSIVEPPLFLSSDNIIPLNYNSISHGKTDLSILNSYLEKWRFELNIVLINYIFNFA